jgi:hypothetical protein
VFFAFDILLGICRSGGIQPLLDLIVVYQAGLLQEHVPPGKNDEIRYATHIETCSDLWIFVRIDFEHHSLARHIGRGAGDFRSSHATGAAPFRPEVDEYGNRRILNHFVEQDFIGCERFGNGRQRRFTGSATTGAGEMLGRNAVSLSAVAAGANDRQSDLRYPESIGKANRSVRVRAEASSSSSPYLMAIGFVGDPTARVMGKGGAQKKKSYTPS